MKRLRLKNNITALFFGIFVLLIIGCTGKQKSSNSSSESQPHSFTAIKYAKGFRIEHFDGYTRLTILNPWNNWTPYQTYHLYKTNGDKLPSEGTNLKIPLESIVVNTFAYFDFLEQLGQIDKITGITDGFRVYNPNILRRIAKDSIADLGDPFKINLEKTIALKPNAILTSAYAQRDQYSERLVQAGIPVIYNLEWMENSPLARAEWIKMIAVFFDKEADADRIFDQIEKRYLKVKEKVGGVEKKYSVMAGDNFQGTWYVPGGRSFNACLFRDANLNYYYEDDHNSGSIGLDIETILTQFGKADYWFGCTADSYEELNEKDPKYKLLKSVKDKHVFNNKNRVTPSGGNDFFESAIANPDLILSDFIKAVYPALLPQYHFTYIKPLKTDNAL